MPFGMNQPPHKPESHEDLLAALNRAVGATPPQEAKKSKVTWAKTLLVALFIGRVLLGVTLLGAAFWAVGYILAWQNILPYVPEWWHGWAIAAALWLVLVITPPTITLKLR